RSTLAYAPFLELVSRPMANTTPYPFSLHDALPIYGPNHEEEALLDVDAVDREVQGGLTFVTHPAGHLLALEHAPRGRRRADGPGLAVVALGAVGGETSGEAVPLHRAREPFTFGGSDRVDLLAGLEGLGRKFLANLIRVGIRGPHFSHVTARGDPERIEALAQRLGDPSRINLPVGE